MPFSVLCSNKGCGKIQEPYLDPKTDKVYCALCNNEIINITQFVKHQLKLNKQFKKQEPQSFSLKCNSCKANQRPKLVDAEIVCSNCQTPITNVSVFFKNMLIQKLKEEDV